MEAKMRWVIGTMVALIISMSWVGYVALAGANGILGWIGAIVYALIVFGIVLAHGPRMRA
jgi:hypothetical protein